MGAFGYARNFLLALVLVGSVGFAQSPLPEARFGIVDSVVEPAPSRFTVSAKLTAVEPKPERATRYSIKSTEAVCGPVVDSVFANGFEN